MTDRRTYGTEWNTGCAALSAAADPQLDTAAFGGRTGTGTGDSAAAERPVCIQIHGREQLLQPESVLSQKAVEQVFQAVCEYSVYRYAKEIAEGFVTIAGGNRVGIAGSAVYQEGKLVQMRHISGLNFRVSHAVTGCAESLYRRTCARQPASLLLVGQSAPERPPCCGICAGFWGLLTG